MPSSGDDMASPTFLGTSERSENGNGHSRAGDRSAGSPLKLCTAFRGWADGSARNKTRTGSEGVREAASVVR